MFSVPALGALLGIAVIAVLGIKQHAGENGRSAMDKG
jgi:hypothetical protein